MTEMSHRPAPTLLFRSCRGVSPSGHEERWEVYDHVDVVKRRHIARQRVHWHPDGSHTETLQISLGHWLDLCRQGTPAALDVMFAPADLVDVDLLGELRSGWRVDDHALEQYRRHVAAAAAQSRSGRLARRLADNYDQLSQWGRYEPTRNNDARQRPIAA